MKKALVLFLMMALIFVAGCQAQEEVVEDTGPKIEKQLLIRVEESDVFTYTGELEGMQIKSFKKTITDDKVLILGELVVENDRTYRNVELQGRLIRVTSGQTVGVSQKANLIGDVERDDNGLYWFELEFVRPEPDTYDLRITLSAEW